jgi:hypothetical protein
MSRGWRAIAGLLALAAWPAAAQAPVYVDQTGRSPDAPPSAADIAYDARLRDSLASAERFDGPMTGGWTLSGPQGDLFALQLNDRDGAVEGAWRDLRRPAALDASGFVDRAEAGLSEVTLRFDGRVAVLRATDQGWRGELTEGADKLPVVLRPTGP